MPRAGQGVLRGQLGLSGLIQEGRSLGVAAPQTDGSGKGKVGLGPLHHLQQDASQVKSLVVSGLEPAAQAADSKGTG